MGWSIMVVAVNTFFFIIVGVLLLCCSIMNPSQFQIHDAPMAFTLTLRQQAVYIYIYCFKTIVLWKQMFDC